jgi:hypothetical protein
MKKIAFLILCAMSTAAFADDNRSHGGEHGAARGGRSHSYQSHAYHRDGEGQRHGGAHDRGGHSDGNAHRYGG